MLSPRRDLEKENFVLLKAMKRGSISQAKSIYVHKCIHTHLPACNICASTFHTGLLHDALHHVYKCKNIFTKMLKDVGIEVPKSIETRSKCSMHADKGRG